MHKDVFTQLLTDFAQPLTSEISCEQDWLHAAFCHQQLPLAGTVFSFFQLRANKWIYAGEKKLDVTDIKMEQSLIRFFLSLHWEVLDLKPVDWKQAESELDRLLEFIKRPELADRVCSFFISNLIENFNILLVEAKSDNPERVKFYLESLEKLLAYSLFFQKKHYFSYFDFNSHYLKFFSAASFMEQEKFLLTFLSTNWFSIVAHPGPIIAWLHALLKTPHREMVLKSYFNAVNQDSELVFQSLHFFAEEELKYTLSSSASRREVEILLKIYSRFKDPFYLDPWTLEDYNNFLKALEKETQLPHYSLNGFISLLTKYYDYLSPEAKEESKIKVIRKILKFHFDQYLRPLLNPWELGVLNEFEPEDYFLLEWESSKGGPVADLSFFNRSLSASENIEELFGVKSFNFKRQFLSLLFNHKFKRVNSELLALCLLKDLFKDVNYRIDLINHFASNLASFVNSYARFVRAFATYDSPLQEIKKASEFIASHYSEEKIYHLFKKNSDYFSTIQNVIDCARGFEGLKLAVHSANSEKANRMLVLPSRIKNLEELHTVIYQRVSLLQTDKVQLYPLTHPVFVLDGFSFFNGWAFSVPKNSWELKIYAINMHNCIGGYVDKILKGESIVLNILLKNKPWINVEIKDRKIWEMKKLKNENLSEQEAKEISLVLAHSGLID